MTSSPGQSDYLKLVLAVSAGPPLEPQDQKPLPKVVPGPSALRALEFVRSSQEQIERLRRSR